MFRSQIFLLVITISVLITAFANENNFTSTETQEITSTRKPASVKICGIALLRMLDMVCAKAKQLLIKHGIITSSSSSSPAKRQLDVDDDPFSRTISIIDYTQFNDTLIGDCCLQACTLKKLLKYC